MEAQIDVTKDKQTKRWKAEVVFASGDVELVPAIQDAVSRIRKTSLLSRLFLGLPEYSITPST